MGDKTDAGAMSIEGRTVQKVQHRILPFIFVLYIVAFLDRINIGFAALTMNQELAITSQQFGLLSGIFFIGYFLFEIPSNLLLHKIGARVWIARILLTWGAVAVLTGFVRSVHQLYVVRFLLGLAEAGFAPGMLLYLTYWFRQQDRARAVGLYLAGMPVASLLGGPISGLVLHTSRNLVRDRCAIATPSECHAMKVPGATRKLFAGHKAHCGKPAQTSANAVSGP